MRELQGSWLSFLSDPCGQRAEAPWRWMDILLWSPTSHRIGWRLGRECRQRACVRCNALHRPQCDTQAIAWCRAENLSVNPTRKHQKATSPRSLDESAHPATDDQCSYWAPEQASRVALSPFRNRKDKFWVEQQSGKAPARTRDAQVHSEKRCFRTLAKQLRWSHLRKFCHHPSLAPASSGRRRREPFARRPASPLPSVRDMTRCLSRVSHLVAGGCNGHRAQ